MEKEAPQPGKDPAPPQHSEQGFAKNKNLRKGRDWGVGGREGKPFPQFSLSSYPQLVRISPMTSLSCWSISRALSGF